MRERATLRLDTGDEVRVEVERDDLERKEIVVRRTDDGPSADLGLLRLVDAHLAAAAAHAAGTADRHLAADRLRPY